MKDYTPFKENGKVEAAAPEPYPPLEVEGPNPQYARLLGIDMAGGRGEMTSITQYLYHSWTLPDFDNAAPTLRQIAQVEMHHLDMLGVLIEKLGGNPKYQAVQNRPAIWTGGMVTYNRTPAMAIRDNMALEQSAIDTYRKQLLVIRDTHVAAVIRRILMDEEIHLLLFKRLLASTGIRPQPR